jgi:hypothetical protein
MTIDEDSRNPKTEPQDHAQGAIHSPYIQKRRHMGSGVRRFIKNRRSVQLAWPKMGHINFPGKQQITAISSLHLSYKTECSEITNYVTLTKTHRDDVVDCQYRSGRTATDLVVHAVSSKHFRSWSKNIRHCSRFLSAWRQLSIRYRDSLFKEKERPTYASGYCGLLFFATLWASKRFADLSDGGPSV